MLLHTVGLRPRAATAALKAAQEARLRRRDPARVVSAPGVPRRPPGRYVRVALYDDLGVGESTRMNRRVEVALHHQAACDVPSSGRAASKTP